MAFLVDEAYLPAVLTVGPMTDEEFARFCAEHPDLSFEVTAEGELIVMPPTYTLTGARSGELFGQLRDWARRNKRGVVFDSSTGWVLPNGARRSPDAAWVSKAAIRGLEPSTLGRYWHICPEFVIELRSSTDRLRTLREKMLEWIENGAKLGWLLDAEQEVVEVFRPGLPTEIISKATKVRGEGPVAGFVLDLRSVWYPLED